MVKQSPRKYDKKCQELWLCTNFLSGSLEDFTKNKDKLDWVKILANDLQFTKVSPNQNFALYNMIKICSASDIDRNNGCQ